MYMHGQEGFGDGRDGRTSKNILYFMLRTFSHKASMLSFPVMHSLQFTIIWSVIFPNRPVILSVVL